VDEEDKEVIKQAQEPEQVDEEDEEEEEEAEEDSGAYDVKPGL
jgi:hypothetical protein